MIEFFADKSNGIDLIINNDGKYDTLHEEHPLIDSLYNLIRDNYTEAFEVLTDMYGDNAFFKHRIVKRFLKCNFSKHDDQPDIDNNGLFQFELVSCPLRGECLQENIICHAKINRVLSDRQIEILRLIVKGYNDRQIADLLHIAIKTAKNHRQNIRQKTGCSNTASLVTYAHEHNLL